jgi:hypothetical protein
VEFVVDKMAKTPDSSAVAIASTVPLSPRIDRSTLDSGSRQKDLKQEFWEKIIACFPLIRHASHGKRRLQQFIVATWKTF